MSLASYDFGQEIASFIRKMASSRHHDVTDQSTRHAHEVAKLLNKSRQRTKAEPKLTIQPSEFEHRTSAAVYALQAQCGVDTFGGRFHYFAQICHPRHVLTCQSDVDKARTVLRQVRESSPEAILQARWTLAASTHPSTGDLIPIPLRMTAWPIMGSLPVSAIMYTARFNGGNLTRTALFQWWNQSENAAVNVCNGAIDPFASCEIGSLATGYGVAVGVACTLAVGAAAALRHLKPTPAMASIAKFAPFPAVAGANIANVVVMRREELTDGIPVFAANSSDVGDPVLVGHSQVAARQALMDTCITRVAIPAANFLVGPVLLTKLMPNIAKAAPKMQMFGCWAATYCAFAAGLSISLALFPQTGKMRSHCLEEHIAAAMPKGVDTVSYNRSM